MSRSNHTLGQEQNESGREYDVALSFAGDDREYVQRVAAALRQSGVSVFCDRHEEAALWGRTSQSPSPRL
jgi:hypothetical protein